jgi:ribosome-binding factor A
MKARHSKSAGPSQRQLRVGEQMRHIIAETMQRGHFNSDALAQAGRLTITEVRVSPDLKIARAYVMALGGDDLAGILPALNDQAHMFQKEINRQAQLKFTPKIRFVADESFESANRIDEILRELRTDELPDEPSGE